MTTFDPLANLITSRLLGPRYPVTGVRDADKFLGRIDQYDVYYWTIPDKARDEQYFTAFDSEGNRVSGYEDYPVIISQPWLANAKLMRAHANP